MSDTDFDFSSILSGGFVVFVGLAINLFLNYVIRLLFARYLSVDQFGLVSIVMATVNVVGLLSILGLDTGIGRYLPRFDDESKRQDVLISALQLAVPPGILAGAVLYLLSGRIADRIFGIPELGVLLAIAAVGTPFVGLTRLSIGTIQGQKRTLPKVLIENISTPVVQLVLMAGVVFYGLQTVAVAWAYVGGFVFSGILGLIYIVSHVSLREGRPTMRRELLSFSAPLIITVAMGSILQYSDTLLLGGLRTASEVGIYNVIYPLSQFMALFLTVFSYLIMPVVSELHSSDDLERANEYLRLTSKWILFLTFPLFITMFVYPTEIIQVTFGAKYTDGHLALAVLAVGFLIHSILGPLGKGLTGIGRTDLIMYDNVGAATLNIVLNLLLIPRYGFLGAAIASVVAYVLNGVLFAYQIGSITGLQPVSTAALRVGTVSTLFAMVLHLALLGQFGSMNVQALVVVGLSTVFNTFVFVRYGEISSDELEIVHTIEERFGLDLAFVFRFVSLIRK